MIEAPTIFKKNWRKFVAVSAEGHFLFSRGLFRSEGLDPSTHCYLAYSRSHQAILFCFTRAIIASGAFRLEHQRPKGSLLKAPTFFEGLGLNLWDWVGRHSVKKAVVDGVAWLMIRRAESETSGASA
jgi:hypothetical protein